MKDRRRKGKAGSGTFRRRMRGLYALFAAACILFLLILIFRGLEGLTGFLSASFSP